MLDKINNFFYPFIALICISTILLALYIEYILSIPACKLCLYQRIPYIFSLIICFFGYFFQKNKFWIYILILTFLSSTILSGYHLGIENNVFKEFSGCTNENINITNKLDLLNTLKKTMPSCKNVDFKLFGLSLATINLVISLIISAISIKIIKYEKNK